MVEGGEGYRAMEKVLDGIKKGRGRKWVARKKINSDVEKTNS